MARIDELTPREIETLELLATGLTCIEIARLWGVSERTVRTHSAHIHRKLGTSSRVDAIRVAQARGLILGIQPASTQLGALRREAERAILHGRRCLEILAQMEETMGINAYTNGVGR